MSDFWGKFDAELEVIYSNYLLVKEVGRDAVDWIHPVVELGEPLSLAMGFTGDLAEIESCGFETTWQLEGIASGVVPLSAIETVAGHPNVLSLEFGEEPELELDKSVKEIKATPQVWEVDKNRGTFGGEATGRGVIIGIIDSGIDFRHPVFLQTGSQSRTRILRIWDQLDNRGGNPPSAANLGFSGKTTRKRYGIEYKSITTKSNIRQRDFSGHGTYVAAIAAGNGSIADCSVGKFQYVGVAPEAELIVVKYLDGYGQRPANFPSSPITRLMDAVNYILKVAEKEKKPVVINCSFASILGPHDGLTPKEKFIDDVFKNKSGRCIVAAAGNEAGNQQHATITLRAGSHVDVAIRLFYEPRAMTLNNPCVVEFWYPSGVTLSAAFRLNNSQARTSVPHVALSQTHTQRNRYTLSHSSKTSVIPQITRNVIRLKIEPRELRDKFSGQRYEIRLSTSGRQNIVVQGWCDQKQTTSYKYGFKFDAARRAGVIVTDAMTVGCPASARNIIAVGAYNPETGALWPLSSRGPLANYGTGYQPPAKPDIAAPGENIDSAISKDERFDFKASRSGCGQLYKLKSGTSAAAPHVTGAVALLFQNSSNLQTSEILSILRENARIDSHVRQAPANSFGAGKLDVEGAVNSWEYPRHGLPIRSGGGSSSSPQIASSPHALDVIFANLHQLEERLIQFPFGRKLLDLIEVHADEIFNLIQTNKRVATIWHRNSGSLIVGETLQCLGRLDRQLAKTINGQCLDEQLRNIAGILVRYGSAQLRKDIEAYVSLLLPVGGRSVQEYVTGLETRGSTYE